MSQRLSSDITRAASKQTYYTIRFLVAGPRRDDAYRAYAYFRLVDDILDGAARYRGALLDVESPERARFMDRQKSTLEQCLRGEPPPNASRHERMLVELVRGADLADGSLESYLRQMMRVMDFDAHRRGKLVTRAELDEYTRWLAVAVSDAMHYFIGGGQAPIGETRYAAVTGAHILHMLRDTFVDLRAGYFNVPREVLEAHGIRPQDVSSAPYRAWVEERVELAREQLDAGRSYFEQIGHARHRLAGLAYIARFEWMIRTLERDGFRLRPEYAERDRIATGLRMGWTVMSRTARVRRIARPSWVPALPGGRA